MLHDLLFALCGHPGGIFKESLGKLQIVPGLPYISPNEENALNRLLQLGSKYMSFQKFIQSHSLIFRKNILNLSADGLQPGCYLKAFCLGLENVLCSYRNTLLKLEEDIVSDSHLSLLHIQQETEKFFSLFAAFSDVISTIKNRKSHGCQILNVLHRHSDCGNALVREAMLAIMSSCHGVMYKQLCSWLLHGLLMDHYNEFFIFGTVARNNVTNTSASEKQINDFEINLSNLPCYIPARTAQVICFIGSSLHLFDCDQVGSEKVKSQSAHSNIQDMISINREEFQKDILKLQQAKEFLLDDFEMVIDKIRCSVARQLWKLCVECGQLISYLNTLKDFFLLGRGELFLSFIDEVGPLLKNPPSRVTEHDVQQLFIRSAAKIQVEDELPFQLFQLSIQSKPVSQDGPFVNIYSIDDGWSRLGMTLKVQWPLHTIFKPSVIEKYNHLFRFLLRVKRTQVALQRVWSVQVRKQQSSDASTDASSWRRSTDMVQWQCRNQMQFFVDNLQYYLQADVLESHYTHLLNKIQTDDDRLRDFESITMAHENFVNALMSQCFVMSGTVCTSLIEIMDLCQQFCDVVVTSSLLLSKDDARDQVVKLWNLYSQKTYIFFQVLNGVCSNQCNPHISQLTLRLDYNRYYSAMIFKSKEATKTLF